MLSTDVANNIIIRDLHTQPCGNYQGFAQKLKHVVPDLQKIYDQSMQFNKNDESILKIKIHFKLKHVLPDLRVDDHNKRQSNKNNELIINENTF